MKKLWKRTAAVLMALVLTVTLIPLNALAEEQAKISISKKKVSVMAYTCGSMTQDYVEDEKTGEEKPGREYYHYDVLDILRDEEADITVKLPGGESVSGDYWTVQDELYDRGFQFTWEDGQSGDKPWEEGGSYEAAVIMLHFPGEDTEPDYETSAKFTVEVLHNPLKSLSAKETVIEVTAGTCGAMTTEFILDENDDFTESEPFFYYDPSQLIKDTVFCLSYDDGREPVTGTPDELWAQDIFLECEPEQGFEHQWTAGKEYPLAVRFMEKTVKLTVRILENPLKSVKIADTVLSVEPETNGHWVNVVDISGKDDGKYYKYDVDGIIGGLEATLEFSDERGTVKGTLKELEKKGVSWTAEPEDFQSSFSPWEEGGEYAVDLDVEGVHTPLTLKIGGGTEPGPGPDIGEGGSILLRLGLSLLFLMLGAQGGK